MKRVFLTLISLLLLLPVTLWAMQDVPSVQIEITGANASDLPTVVVTANVYDRLRQPIFGLTAANFQITGELADRARIVSVENVTDDDLSFAVVLVIDTSSSMAGIPLERAKEAAISFVSALGPNDPVAIITFNSNVRQVLDYTTDRDVLIRAINNLGFGGKTALYEAGLVGVEKAAQSPTARRVVILLSDGAEFGGVSDAARGSALNEALLQGVPVYTIGLGFGTDRTYLQELSSGTNARYYESPTPDELLEIYNALAQTLRSQYIITITADIPADGSSYDLTIETTTDAGSASATAVLRAPIPIPIVSLPDLPTEPIAGVTVVTADVRADDAITSAEFLVDGVSAGTLTAPPYTLTIDPVSLVPGRHTITFTVTDATGDVATVTRDFDIAALPSSVTILGLGEREISEATTVTLDVTGQTAAVSAAYSLDGVPGPTVTEAPFSFTIDPQTLTPGEHVLNVTVVNQAGVSITSTQTFVVAALPPIITVTGLQNDQRVSAPTQVTVTATGQVPTRDITIGVWELAPVVSQGSTATITINPANLPPGTAIFSAAAVLENGQAGTVELSFEVAALPPDVTLSGLQPGETLDENTIVSVGTSSQTPVTGVVYRMDGDEYDRQTTPPFSTGLDVLALGPGAHILSVEVTNAGGQTTTVVLPFIVSEGPSLTATATLATSTPTPTAVPTLSPTPTPTRTPSPTATFTPVATVTADESGLVIIQAATETAGAQVVLDAQATTDAAATAQSVAEGQATAAAQATTDAAATAQSVAEGQATAAAQATLDTQAAATVDARATANAQATTDAEVAANAQATATANAAVLATADALTTATASAQAVLDARATSDAAATANALAAANAQATLDAGATANAQATLDAVATVTENARVLATAAAGATATVNAQATTDAEIAANVRATADAAATANAQATLDAAATANAQATLDAAAATANAQATLDAAAATANAQATLDAAATAANAQATLDAAAATANAQATLDTAATANAQATLDAVATANAQATLDAAATAANAQATLDAAATANAQATLDAAATANAQATLDAVATATENARVLATAAAAATATANAQATLDAAATATANARATTDAEATANAQATLDAAATATANAQATLDAAATATANARATTDAEATANAQATLDAVATANAQATLDAAATATANAQTTLDAAATATANARATANAQATLDAAATATANARATTDARATEEATPEATQAAPTPQPTEIAQLIASPTATSEQPAEDETPAPTLTPLGTLTPEVQAAQTQGAEVVPIVLLCIVLLVILVIIFLILRRRRQGG